MSKVEKNVKQTGLLGYGLVGIVYTLCPILSPLLLLYLFLVMTHNNFNVNKFVTRNYSRTM
jgi:hypothetical protein